MKTVERWFSDRLQQELTVARWGTYGRPVLILPSAGGDAEEGEAAYKGQDAVGGAEVATLAPMEEELGHRAEKENGPKEGEDPAPFDEGLEVVVMGVAPDARDEFGLFVGRIVREDEGECAGAEAVPAGIVEHAETDLCRDEALVGSIELVLHHGPLLGWAFPA